jgi:hypothetical protein
MKFAYGHGDRPLEGYTIKQGLGRGGFGEVYYAVSDAGKEVALKLVQRNLDVELRGVGQCLNLKHANLVSLHDVRETANGDYWVVMEYVSGETLDKVIARSPNGLPPEEVLLWLEGVCAGVGYLHEHGVVHRDVKPGNVFLDNGTVKLGDYGLSKFISASRRSGQTGSVGTVHYMAPEVLKGRYGREVDLYALGVILYEMLTGRVPFGGESPGEILMKHLTAVPDLGPLPPAYRPVVGRLLDKDPFRRYSSAQAMLADLKGYLAAGVDTEGWEGPPAVAVPVPVAASAPGPGSATPAAAAPALKPRRGAGNPSHLTRLTDMPFWWRLLFTAFIAVGVGLFVGWLAVLGSREPGVGAGFGVMAGLWVFGFITLLLAWQRRQAGDSPRAPRGGSAAETSGSAAAASELGQTGPWLARARRP